MTQPLIHRAQRIRWLRAWTLETDNLQGWLPSGVTLHHSPHFSKPWLPPLRVAVAVPALHLCGITWDDTRSRGSYPYQPQTSHLPLYAGPPNIACFLPGTYTGPFPLNVPCSLSSRRRHLVASADDCLLHLRELGVRIWNLNSRAWALTSYQGLWIQVGFIWREHSLLPFPWNMPPPSPPLLVLAVLQVSA